MRTLDGAQLALRALANYPAGSVSRRETVCIVPLGPDPESQFAELNGVITDAVYAAWGKVDLTKPMQASVAREYVTAAVLAALKTT